jgi:nicotinate-nucleotide--dimethylbenzimidazole phosphoribosyltransferase
MLEFLDARPLLNLEMRLGEGTGAALGIGLLESAVNLYLNMATFQSAGVSTSTPPAESPSDGAH